MGEFLTKEAAYERLDFAKSKGIEPEQALQDLAAAGYEIEGYNTSFSPLSAVKNVPKSLWEFGKAIVSAAANPNQTIMALSSVAAGAIKVGAKKLGIEEKTIESFEKGAESFLRTIGAPVIEKPEGMKDEESFKNMVRFFVDRYGSVERFLETVERDPVGVLADAATVVGFTGGALKTAGTLGKIDKIAEMGRVGGALEKVAAAGEKVTQVSRALEPTKVLQQTAKGIIKITDKPTRNLIAKINKATNFEKTIAEHAFVFQKRGLPITESQAAKFAQQTFKKPIAQIAAEWGIYGSYESMAKQFENVARNSKRLVDEGLAKIEGVFRSKAADTALDDLSNVLDDVKSDELLRVRETVNNLKVKSLEEGLTLSELNQVKRWLDDFDNPFKSSPNIAGIATTDFLKAGVKAEDIANIRKSIQTLIENEAAKQGFKDVRELNKQTALGTKAQNALENAELALKNRKPFIIEFVSSWFGGGSLLAAATMQDPRFVLAAVGYVGFRKLLQKPEFLTTVANKLMSLSDTDYKTFQQTFQTGRLTPKSKSMLRKFFGELRPAFPELRLAGIAERETE